MNLDVIRELEDLLDQEPQLPDIVNCSEADACERLKCRHKSNEPYTERLYQFICQRLKEHPHDHGLDPRYVEAAKRITDAKAKCLLSQRKVQHLEWLIKTYEKLFSVYLKGLIVEDKKKRAQNQLNQQLRLAFEDGISKEMLNELKKGVTRICSEFPGSSMLQSVLIKISIIETRTSIFDKIDHLAKVANEKLTSIEARTNLAEKKMREFRKVLSEKRKGHKAKEMLDRLKTEENRLLAQLEELKIRQKDTKLICGIDAKIIKERFDLKQIITMNYKAELQYKGFQFGLNEPSKSQIENWKAKSREAIKERIRYVFTKSKADVVNLDDDSSNSSQLSKVSGLKEAEASRLAQITSGTAAKATVEILSSDEGNKAEQEEADDVLIIENQPETTKQTISSPKSKAKLVSATISSSSSVSTSSKSNTSNDRQRSNRRHHSSEQGRGRRPTSPSRSRSMADRNYDRYRPTENAYSKYRSNELNSYTDGRNHEHLSDRSESSSDRSRRSRPFYKRTYHRDRDRRTQSNSDRDRCYDRLQHVDRGERDEETAENSQDSGREQRRSSRIQRRISENSQRTDRDNQRAHHRSHRRPNDDFKQSK